MAISRWQSFKSYHDHLTSSPFEDLESSKGQDTSRRVGQAHMGRDYSYCIALEIFNWPGLFLKCWNLKIQKKYNEHRDTGILGAHVSDCCHRFHIWIHLCEFVYKTNPYDHFIYDLICSNNSSIWIFTSIYSVNSYVKFMYVCMYVCIYVCMYVLSNMNSRFSPLISFMNLYDIWILIWIRGSRIQILKSLLIMQIIMRKFKNNKQTTKDKDVTKKPLFVVILNKVTTTFSTMPYKTHLSDHVQNFRLHILWYLEMKIVIQNSCFIH